MAVLTFQDGVVSALQLLYEPDGIGVRYEEIVDAHVPQVAEVVARRILELDSLGRPKAPWAATALDSD